MSKSIHSAYKIKYSIFFICCTLSLTLTTKTYATCTVPTPDVWVPSTACRAVVSSGSAGSFRAYNFTSGYYGYVDYTCSNAQVSAPGYGVTTMSSGPCYGLGTVNVSSNIPSASWTITGPETIGGSGLSQSTSGKWEGTYTISWNSVGGYATPPSQSLTLVGSGGSITFSGTYGAAPSVDIHFSLRNVIKTFFN